MAFIDIGATAPGTRAVIGTNDQGYLSRDEEHINANAAAVRIDANGADVLIDGTIVGASHAIVGFADTGSVAGIRLTVGPTGIVRGFDTEFAAIRLDDDDNTVLNAGYISGSYGIIFVSADNAEVSNSGLIEGQDRYAVFLSGSEDTSVVNTGEISAPNDVGVYLSASDNARVFNSGTIVGTTGIQYLSTPGNASFRIENTGLIAATGSDNLAIDDLTGDDATIVNRGEIVGDIFLSAGDNTLDNDGGIITGSVTTGAGADYFILDDRNVDIDAGNGSDTLEWRGEGPIDLSGFTSIEVLVLANGGSAGVGSSAANAISGSYGSDALFGGGGADDLDGGLADDFLIGGTGADDLDGGDGFEIAAYIDAKSAVEASLVTGGISGDAAADTYSSIEGLIGSDFTDTLTGDGAGNVLEGGAGADALFGGGGNDLLIGDAGDASAALEAFFALG